MLASPYFPPFCIWAYDWWQELVREREWLAVTNSLVSCPGACTRLVFVPWCSGVVCGRVVLTDARFRCNGGVWKRMRIDFSLRCLTFFHAIIYKQWPKGEALALWLTLFLLRYVGEKWKILQPCLTLGICADATLWFLKCKCWNEQTERILLKEKHFPGRVTVLGWMCT